MQMTRLIRNAKYAILAILFIFPNSSCEYEPTGSYPKNGENFIPNEPLVITDTKIDSNNVTVYWNTLDFLGFQYYRLVIMRFKENESDEETFRYNRAKVENIKYGQHTFYNLLDGEYNYKIYLDVVFESYIPEDLLKYPPATVIVR
jgi:hypothetical protein